MASQASSSSSFFPQTFTTPITIKLDDDNFLIWQQQVLATIRGLKLSKYILEDCVPPKFATKEDEVSGTLTRIFEF
jgi:hypothetical protein